MEEDVGGWRWRLEVKQNEEYVTRVMMGRPHRAGTQSRDGMGEEGMGCNGRPHRRRRGGR
jgi:hypothetical protein